MAHFMAFETVLRAFLQWGSLDGPGSDQGLAYRSLPDLVAAAATEELGVIEDVYVQKDEQHMDLTYEESWWYGLLQNMRLNGVVSLFGNVCSLWKEKDVDVMHIAQRFNVDFQDVCDQS